MFPFSAILIGVSDELLPAVRQELANVGATAEAEYHGEDTAIEGLRAKPKAKRLFIVHFESSEDAKCVRRLVETQHGSPILALVDVSNSTNLLEANRAGAMQVIPLPLQPSDLNKALKCLALQYQQITKECPIIAFTGSAPGCGASTLATNAAYEIATQRKQHTVFIELAQQMGVLSNNLDVQPTYTLSDLLVDPDLMDAQLVQKSLVRVADNLDILAGSHGVGPPAVIPLSGVLRVLEYIKPLAQSIILDIPCTYDEIQFEALGAANQIVLVGEQSIASIRTLKLILDTLRPGPISRTFYVVINRYDPTMEGLSVGNLEKALGQPNICTIPDDRPTVLTAANEGKFLRQSSSRCQVLMGIDALVERLLGIGAAPAQSSGVRLLSRFFSSFRT